MGYHFSLLVVIRLYSFMSWLLCHLWSNLYYSPRDILRLIQCCYIYILLSLLFNSFFFKHLPCSEPCIKLATKSLDEVKAHSCHVTGN